MEQPTWLLLFLWAAWIQGASTQINGSKGSFPLTRRSAPKYARSAYYSGYGETYNNIGADLYAQQVQAQKEAYAEAQREAIAQAKQEAMNHQIQAQKDAILAAALIELEAERAEKRYYRPSAEFRQLEPAVMAQAVARPRPAGVIGKELVYEHERETFHSSGEGGEDDIDVQIGPHGSSSVSIQPKKDGKRKAKAAGAISISIGGEGAFYGPPGQGAMMMAGGGQFGASFGYAGCPSGTCGYQPQWEATCQNLEYQPYCVSVNQYGCYSTYCAPSCPPRNNMIVQCCQPPYCKNSATKTYFPTTTLMLVLPLLLNTFASF